MIDLHLSFRRAMPRGAAPVMQRKLGPTNKPDETVAALRDSAQRLKAFAEMSSDWFWEQDADLHFLYRSEIPLTSLPSDVGKSRWDLADPAMDPRRWDPHKADLAARRPFRDFRWERIQTDGKRRYMSTTGNPIFNETGTFEGYYGTGRDITADVQAAEQLLRAKEAAEAANRANADLVTAVRFANDAIIGLASDHLIKTWNPAAERLYGLPAAAVIGQNIAMLWPVGQQLRMAAALREVGHGQVLSNLEIAPRHSNGRVTHVSVSAAPVIGANGGVAGLVVTARDISEHKRSEERIVHLAHHDALTGLPNRTLLNAKLGLALNVVARNRGALAVLALDLDRFKTVNDAFGHATGDQLLRLVTERLKATISPSDTLARIGGDEFVVVHTDIGQPIAASELARRLIAVLSQPFDLNDLQMRIGTSVGIAVYPADGESPAELLKKADTALYRAKADQHGAYRFFEPRMDLQLRERWSLEQDLRLAIGTGQLRLDYQPVFETATRSITGFEALLRWRHPVRGNVPPMEFISIAEETGLITALGSWVLEEACRAAAAWTEPKRIAVNLSAAQLRSGQLPAQVASILERTRLPAGMLELEVTETMLIRNHHQALATLKELRLLGVRISCDDFGTGYSSFSYIQKLAFDRIKIDKSFVNELGINPSAARIVQAILAMAQSLGMDVTAEGVETEQQFAVLRDLGCGEIQGFLLGKPLPADSIASAAYASA